MSADPLITCLENLTDYSRFETLCSDLMVLEGYPNLEPLGGFSDKGRDAIHVSRQTGQTTIFAYSVREDWRNKLDEDAQKIHTHGHECNQLVFLTTASPTTSQRDTALSDIGEGYGCSLDIFGIERIAMLLRSKHSHLVAKHPSVFTPAFFPITPGQIDPTTQDFVVIDYAGSDEALALWLSRRLTAMGYRVWCKRLSLRGGEQAVDVIDGILRNHAAKFVTILSQEGISDPNIQARRSQAIQLSKGRVGAFVIPLLSKHVNSSSLDDQTRSLSAIQFDLSWAQGLHQLKETLEKSETPRPLSNGAELAANTFQSSDVTKREPENLYSNCLPITQIPKAVYVFSLGTKLTDQIKLEVVRSWAIRIVNDQRVISLHHPSPELTERLAVTESASYLWLSFPRIEGINTQNLLSELLAKSFNVRCRQRGLLPVDHRGTFYFPLNLLPKNRLTYTRPDGDKTRVTTSGERSVRRGDKYVFYRYHLTANFHVRSDIVSAPVAVLKVGVHILDAQGNPLPPRSAGARRRRMFKNWYNYQWFSRTLAISRFLAEDGDQIIIGTRPEQQVRASSVPLFWEAPIRILEESTETSDLGPMLPAPLEIEDEEDDDTADDAVS